MPTISCEPNDLIEASKCFKCIPTGTQNEVIIYLLNQMLTTPKTVQELLDGAKCYKCIPQGMQSEVQTYLLCEALNAIP
jgi:hypothetical protein